MDTNNNVKLSNVIGAPFNDYVLLQLYIRAARNSTQTRSNEEVLFLANKSAWARLVSSVNIQLPVAENTTTTAQDYTNYYNQFNINSATNYDSPESLAENWILEAGTSIQDGNGITLREGIGPDGAYGLGGTEELGYRPMPGLTSVQIETTGRLGSLRQATIQFKVWNMNQLNVVEALYFRLGYSMLLEWGHTQYFDNTGDTGVFHSNDIYGIDNPFVGSLRKEDVQQLIARRARNTFGNYDGMLGIVSNFTWALNQEGGYDCTVKLVGLGAVMDSMRINQAYKLPDGTVKEYKKNKSALTTAQDALIAAYKKKIKDLQNPPAPAVNANEPIDPAPKNPSDLRKRLATYDHYTKPAVTDLMTDYGINAFDKKENFTAAKEQADHDYYTPFSNITAANIKDKALKEYAGLWLNQGNTGWTRIPLGGVSSVVIDTALLNYAAENIVYQTIDGPKTVNQLQVTGGTYVSKIFDYNTQTYVYTPSQGGYPTVTNIPLTSPLNSGATDAGYLITGLKGADGATASVTFSIKANISKTAQDVNFQPTRQEIITILDTWQSKGSSEITNVKVAQNGNNKVTITGTFTGEVIAGYTGTPGDKANVIKGNTDGRAEDNGNKRRVPITFEFSTDNPGFISHVGPVTPPTTVTPKTAQTANTGDTNGTVNNAGADQVDSPTGFGSALQAMLVVVQTQVRASATDPTVKVKQVNIKDQTDKFFQDGALNGVLKTGIPNTVPDPGKVTFDLVQFAAKGFNSALMVNPSLYNSIPQVDFDNLCKAFLIRYDQGDTEGAPDILNSPTYIQFGYLLAFINNMCLIYDSAERTVVTNNNTNTGTSKRPYVYIDFNPETNFCLTSPQQLSVDPLTCLIPVDSTSDGYKSIFPENIAPTLNPIFNPSDSNQNIVSGVLHKAGLYFKSGENAYQGKIMNVLLNIDYLLNLVTEFAGPDPEHAVKLGQFLDRIMVDINKSLGNTNAFRVAYRDDSNTIQIQDDQWVPSLIGPEISMLDADVYNSRVKNQSRIAGLLPIFGSPGELPVAGAFSLARQFKINTVMSTKLASMIAISAQAATGSVNATDHSSLSYLNQNYQDRYKQYVQDASNGGSGTDNAPKSTGNNEDNDKKAAVLFNAHVTSIYSNFKLSADKVELAKNYYIERMSKVKSDDPITSAAPFIPAEVEMTLDGISGIIMGNAFTIPLDRLPLSLRGDNGLAKIAFIVTGLTHTVQSNEWLTKIKGQMIKLREQVKIPGASTIITEIQNATTVKASSSTTARGTGLFINKNAPATSNYLLGTASMLNIGAPAHPNWGGLASIWQNNNAWDLGTKAGTPVYAIVNGTISKIGFYENHNTVWGYSLTLTGDGNSFFYTHLDSTTVSNGATVKKGALLGYVGQWPADYTRLVNAPHLHIGIETGKLSDYIDKTGKFI